MKKLLIFTRPFTNRFTHLYRDAGVGRYAVSYVSDFRYRDDHDLIGRQYRLLAKGDSTPLPSTHDISIVIQRDRYLRHLPEKLAASLVHACYGAICSILDELRPDAFIGLPMDNYYLDLFEAACRARGIYNLFPLQSFLPGRTRITRRGEWNYVADPSEELVDKYYDLLKAKYFRPVSLSKHKGYRGLAWLYTKERCKKIIFESLKVIKRDPYSFHYNCIYPMPGSITVESYKNMFVRRMFMSIEKTYETLRLANQAGRKIIFFPLQFSPEASINYHIADHGFGRYEELIDTLLDTVPDDALLVVKEHPDIYGCRPERFYKRFLNRKNVLLAPVEMSASTLIDFANDLIVTGGASTGVEAVIKGKNVITLGAAYYSDKISLHDVPEYDNLRNWTSQLNNVALDEVGKRQFLARILKNTLPGPFRFVRTPSDAIVPAIENLRVVLDFVDSQIAGV